MIENVIFDMGGVLLDGIVYHGDVPLLRQRLREKGVNI